jgi:hypothetical protein
MILAAPTASLILRARTPLWLQSNYVVDSGLFGTLAGHLAGGEWLGPFSGDTLVKGPSYPMFIAASYRAHIPLLIAEQLLYLLASAVVATAFGRLAGSRWAGGVVFTVLALNPIHLGAAASQLLREVVYTSFALLLIGGIVLLVSVVPTLTTTRYGWGYVLLVPGAGLIGVVAAGYYLCREERAWIAPALLVAAVAGVWSWRRRLAGVGPRIWVGLLIVLLTSGAVAYAGINYVVQRNKHVYGAAVIADLADGQLSRAYVAWQSVEVGPRVRRIPVPSAVRTAVYAVSPAADELRPYLEGSARHWLRCEGSICDYNGATFIWALRESIASAGDLHTETQLQGFSRTLADQISQACRSHRLTCGGRGLPLVPSLQASDIGPISASAVVTAKYLLSFEAASPKRVPASGGFPSTWAAATRAIPDARDETALQSREQAALARQQPVTVLQSVYRWLAYPALAVSFAGMVWEAFRPRPGANRAVAIATIAILTALLARIAVFAVVDAMSYAAAENSNYALPGNDLLVLFIVAGCWLFGAHIYDRSTTHVVVSQEPDPPQRRIDRMVAVFASRRRA